MSKRLSDITRKNSTDKAAQLMDSLMPTIGEASVPPVQAASPADEPVVEPQQREPEPIWAATPVPAAPVKSERSKKASGIILDDIVIPNPKDGEAFNKMIRVTDEHHELLRTLAFKYRKNMNVFVHNLMDLLNQAYIKDQQKDA